MITADAQDHRRLELFEIQSIPVPDDVEIAGGMLSGTEEFLAWTRTGYVVLGTRSGTAACQLPITQIVAARTASPGSLEVVTSKGLYRLEIANGPACASVDVRPILVQALDNEIVSAAFDGQWVIGMINPGGSSRLARLGPQGFVAIGSANLNQQLRLRASHISAHNREVVISEMGWPFGWRIAGRGASSRKRQFDRDTLLASNKDTAQALEMVGTGMRFLDEGFISVLADPRSDLRALVVFDRSGSRQRIATVSIPLGVLDTRPDSRLLLAVRRTDVIELVVYGWRWT